MYDAAKGRGPHAVAATGLVLVLAFIAVRVWALSHSWFYMDDFELITEARRDGLSFDHLMEPFNGHVMPGVRALAWVAGTPSGLSWVTAAAIGTLLQAGMALAALWAFLVVFGQRWASLVPLSLFLSSAATIPATMWWTANTNQVPVVAALFLATGAWVSYLRMREPRWLVASLSTLILGLLFDTKALLILVVLVLVALSYFTHGSLPRRAAHAARHYWPAVLVFGLTAGGYVVYYVSEIQSPFVELDADVLAGVAANLFGTAFPSALVGGPWRWTSQDLYADPWPVAVHMSWLVVGCVVIAGILLRRRTARAWLLLGSYLMVVFALLATSRATAFGPDVGLELRFVTDCVAVWALCVGFAFLEVPGATESSVPREAPGLAMTPGPVVIGTSLVIVAGMGLQSTVAYALGFERWNAARPYSRTLDASLQREGRVDLADGLVPQEVLGPLNAPYNSFENFVALFDNSAHFPLASPRLAVVGPSGQLHHALVEPGVVSEDGPRADCGWRVSSAGRDVPLAGRAFPWQWWLQIGYLSSVDSPVTVSAGGSRIDTDVQRGLNTLYVMLDGTFDEVRIDGLDDDVTLCVDTIIVGQPVPGGVLE